MNYAILLVETILICFMLILFYKQSKKNGLYLCVAVLSSILGITSYKLIDISGFQVNLGLPILMGIFICSNIIIQRYWLDELKKIVIDFLVSYISVFLFVNLVGVISYSEYNLVSNLAYDELFAYNLVNLRIFVSHIISITFLLCYNGYVYYSIRRNKNSLLFSNIGSMLVIQFIESIIFVLMSYIFVYDATELFGMIVVRYLIKVVIGLIGTLPVYVIVKMKDK